MKLIPFIADLFFIPMVYTRDHDGEIRLRRVKTTPWGATCNGVSSNRHVILKSDGTTDGSATYTREWKPANKSARKMSLAKDVYLRFYEMGRTEVVRDLISRATDVGSESLAELVKTYAQDYEIEP